MLWLDCGSAGFPLNYTATVLKHTYIRTYIHTYIHTYVHIYIHTYIHTYILLQTKLKLGWLICKVEDYVVAKRCFRCSRFNHRFSECRGEETCPLCARSHKLKECTAAAEELKCINCMTYNKYNQNAKICVNHSSLDKKCPSLNAILQKYIQNTDY